MKNNSRKQTCPGRSVYANMVGGPELWAFAHENPAFCQKEIDWVNDARNIDVGCGSGILSLGAGKLWSRETQVIAVDIDDEAVLVTRQNAEDNGLENVITAGISNGYQSPLVKENKPYDLIFANILARPLIEMAPDLAASLRPGGYAVLSGFIGEQENWVIDAHIEQGLELIKIYEMDNWRAALMEKKA